MIETVHNFTRLDVTTSATPNTAARLSATSAYCRKAIIQAVAANGDTVLIGVDNTCDVQISSATDVYVIEAPLGYQFDLKEWWAKSGTASQVLRILYI